MKRVTVHIVILFLLSVKVSAQVNLIPNPSFEIYTTCPNSNSQIYYAVPWQGVTTNSTDYFNVCSANYGIPFGSGFQYARTGNAYAGIWAINSYGWNYREYLQVKLEDTLQQDSCYLVEFYCNAGNWTRYCVNKMGAFLSNSAVSNVGPGLVLQYIPQIVSSTFLSDTLNWMRVGGYYKASGGEQYITIGNFSTDNTTDTLQIGGFYDGSGYLIDDVTVQKLTTCDTTTSLQEYTINKAFKLYPNPNDGNMIFEYSLEEHSTAMFVLNDITGRVINKYNLTIGENNSLTINENELNNGVYLYQFVVNDKLVKKDKLVIIR